MRTGNVQEEDKPKPSSLQTMIAKARETSELEEALGLNEQPAWEKKAKKIKPYLAIELMRQAMAKQGKTLGDNTANGEKIVDLPEEI